MTNPLRVLLLAVLMSGCAAQVSYQEDFNSNENFSQYKTYGWHEGNVHNESTKQYLDNDIVDQRIRDDIDQQLRAKGFVSVDSGEADFWVNYTITVREDLEVHTYNTYETDYAAMGMYNYYGYRGNFGSPYRYYSSAYAPVRTETHKDYDFHKVGTLVIDIVNSETGKLSWRGTAEGTLDKSQVSAEQRDEKLAVVIEKTLHDFPPQPKSGE